MRALVQRVRDASVSIDGLVHGRINRGIVIFLGVTHTDSTESAHELASRCASLRIFQDSEAKMNLSLKDIGGSALVVSQFTLYADTRKGNRPSFIGAAEPEKAERLYDDFVRFLGIQLGKDKVCTGVFRAMMDIQLINDGPVTVMIESKGS